VAILRAIGLTALRRGLLRSARLWP
jgi:hypothetical protein